MKLFFETYATGKAFSGDDLLAILDALPTPISFANLGDSRIRFMNRSFRDTFGYTVEDFDTVDSWIARAYPFEEDRITSFERWRNLWQADGTGVAEVSALEIRIRCADGTLRTVQHRGILLYELGIGIASFEDITDRKKAEEMLREIAFRDPLTGLANRRAMLAQWQAWAEKHMPVESKRSALLLIDLDGFKAINDRLGHDAGDQVLVTVSARLQQNVRHKDLVCRIGGDEFVVCMNDISNAGHVETVCQRIIDSLGHPITLDGTEVAVGATVGISLYPQDGSHLNDLIRSADKALYKLKATNKGGWLWFSEPMM